MVGKRVNKFGQGPPPPLFGQCPKEIDFSYGRCSLNPKEKSRIFWEMRVDVCFRAFKKTKVDNL